MSDVALRMDHVFKRFRRGQKHDSLRDLVPYLVRQAVKRDRDRSLTAEEFWVLNDVSFEVKQGEAIGIVGHNGAGKSTMLKHLSGIMEPTRGTLAVRGRLSALIEVGAGFHSDLTGRENVYLNGVILGMRREEIRRRFDEIVAFAELEEFIDTPVKRYSSGMFARLGFSVAAHLEPDILVIDEVLSVGDYAFQRKGLEKMRSVARSGATVIFVSHNLPAVADFCQRVLLMDHGRIIADGPTDTVIRKYLDGAGGAVLGGGQGPVRVTAARITGDAGETGRFVAGSRARIDVEFQASEPSEKLAVVLDIRGDDSYELFNTSSQRLGHPPIDLGTGETGRYSFDVDLNLADGTYHLGVYVYRYDVEQLYDHVFPAASFVVASDRDTKGPANLYPRVIEGRALAPHAEPARLPSPDERLSRPIAAR